MTRRGWITATNVCGVALLRPALSSRPGSARFYVLSLATAGVWTAGAIASGYPLPAGARRGGQRLIPVGTGAGAFAAFYAAALVARRTSVLDRAIRNVLRHAGTGSAPLLVLTTCANAVAEELFFRGAVYAAAQRHPIVNSALAYTAATAATRNPALTLAGAAMGTLLARQRRATGGVEAPALTHLTWSLLMVRFLPALFRGNRRPDADAAPVVG